PLDTTLCCILDPMNAPGSADPPLRRFRSKQGKCLAARGKGFWDEEARVGGRTSKVRDETARGHGLELVCRRAERITAENAEMNGRERIGRKEWQPGSTSQIFDDDLLLAFSVEVHVASRSSASSAPLCVLCGEEARGRRQAPG